MNETTAWVAVRFEDPAGLLETPRADDILRSHHAAVAAARGVSGGDPFEAAFPAGRGLEAVLLAIRVQTETRLARATAMATDSGLATAPRLQVAVAVAATEAEATALSQSAGGGQILCAREVQRTVAREPGADHLAWGTTSRASVLECLYDDAAALLDEPFERMFAAEVRGWIEPYRRARGIEEGLPVPERPNTRNELFGVALSGGGMRSAVFSLGVLQAMARNGVLKDADYLSTVSGGGYAGASLTSLCLEPLPYTSPERLDCSPERFPFAFPRTRFGGPVDSAGERSTSLPVHGNESPALHHVRGHARLLGQSIGLFSAYTWQMVTRYVLSAVALWVLFLLPLLTLVTLAGIALWHPVREWDTGWRIAAMFSPIIVAAPAVMLGSLTLHEGHRAPIRRAAIRFAHWLHLVAVVLAVAAVTTGLIWAVVRLQQESDRGLLGAGGLLAGISSSMLVVGLRKVLTPGVATRMIWLLAVGIGGYVLLAVIVFAWHWLLYDWTEGEFSGLYWVALAVAAVLLLLASFEAVGKRALNVLSLHGLYRSRIEATWVIAARREPPRPSDDGPRSSIWRAVWQRPDITIGDLARASEAYGPAAPYPLICTTLSFPGNQGDPKLLDRRGEAFVIAPFYSGSALSRWKPTAEMPDVQSMPLSGAAAVSGAAVSPNMGDRTVATISVLTTLLNVRLGQWVDNPRPSRRSPAHRLVMGRPLVLYLKEMLGLASRDDGNVYLSDGGHFENLGLYELLRRRCKYIVAIAADIEPAPGEPLGFGNIGTAIRYARVDFGIEVSMPDLRPMLRDPASGMVASYYSVGTIRYPTPGGHSEEGVLVLVKSAVGAQDLPADLLTYWRRANPGFPYDPTTDQQLDQPQFESYRQLGFIAGRQAFRSAREEATVAEKFAQVQETFATTEWWSGEMVDAVRALRGDLS